jgi:hypothetical protein
MEPSATFFGLPLVLKRVDASILVEDLERLFRRQTPGGPQDLDHDLRALNVYFDPLRTGSAIRRRLGELPPSDPLKSRLLRAPLVIGDGRNVLVTPEGRIALDVLTRRLAETPDTAPLVALDPDEIELAQGLAYSRYRTWSIGRLSSVLGLLEGKAERLRPLSIGWLLLLLVNGSRSAETALSRPESSDQERKLDHALGDILTAFVSGLEPGASARDFRQYQGWVATEARRRAAHLQGPSPSKPFVRSGRERELVNLAIRELRSRRTPPRTEVVLSAFDNLVATYRERLPVLASLGLAHERRAETREIRDMLEQGLAADADRP